MLPFGVSILFLLGKLKIYTKESFIFTGFSFHIESLCDKMRKTMQ